MTAVTTATRLAAPDLARGYMLLLIALANVPWFAGVVFIDPVPAEDGLSRVMEALTVLLADGRAYPLFAILFGFGLAVLTGSRARAGLSPAQIRRYLLVRMLWLFGFGAVHGIFFPGDILGAYAIAGLIAVPLVLARAWVVWLVAGISGCIWFLTAVVAMVATGVGLPQTVPGLMEPAGFLPLLNLVLWAVASIGTGLFAALPFVLFGLMIGRLGLLAPTPAAARTVRLAAAVGLGVGVLTGLPGALAALGLIGGQGWWIGLARLTGPFMAVGYLAAAALIGHRWAGRGAGVDGHGPLAAALIATGRRSLTCYLLQTVLFVLVLVPWGPLALAGQVSPGVQRLIGVGVWVVTVLLAVLLARTGRPGPADALLRRLSNRRPPHPAGPGT